MIGVIVRAVPDLVEGLEISEREVLPYRYMANEMDEYAVEQAVILKEKYGLDVEVIGLANEEAYSEIDDALFTAIARGADRAYKIMIPKTTSYKIARALSDVLKKYDLILTGTIAIDEYYGLLSSLIAHELKVPYVGSVIGVEIDGENLIVKKELEGGLICVLRLKKPAVLGIITSERPPRYIPFSRLREVMKSHEIKEIDLSIEEEELDVKFKEPPEPKVEFIEGTADEVAEKLAKILKEMIT